MQLKQINLLIACSCSAPGVTRIRLLVLRDAQRGDTSRRGLHLAGAQECLLSSHTDDNFFTGTGDDFFIFMELSPRSLMPEASNPHPGRAVVGGNQMGQGGVGAASKGFPLVGYFILPNCW